MKFSAILGTNRYARWWSYPLKHTSASGVQLLVYQGRHSNGAGQFHGTAWWWSCPQKFVCAVAAGS